jgi:hypothetical protein
MLACPDRRLNRRGIGTAIVEDHFESRLRLHEQIEIAVA